MTETKLKISIEGRDLLSVLVWGEKGMYPTLITWNDLMPVVYKIRELYELEPDYLDVYDDVVELRIATDIKEVYERIITFIRWYNEQQSIKQ
jgi:hypothetical protein